MSFVIALVLSLLLMPAARSLGLRIGLIDRPTDRALKIHASPVSVLGGLAAILAFLTALALVGDLDPTIATAVGLATLVGLFDDARPLPPWVRIVAIGLSGGLASQALPLPGGNLGRLLLGALLGIVCANGVNLVDGQDGLAGGLAAIAALFMAASGFVMGDVDGRSHGLALAASLIVFLAWNRSPAKLFLGNGGAYGVGLALAVQAGLAGGSGPGRLVIQALCLGPFAFELIVTVSRRLASGRSLVVGDRKHTYDVLARRLGSRSRSTLALYGAGAGSGCFALAAAAMPEPERFLVPGLWALLALLAGRLLWRSALTDDDDIADATPPPRITLAVSTRETEPGAEHGAHPC
jgi:UDP-GlcNAc:undecaprenyl-phosphate GlcNAc-1-phosphate transferase